MRTVLRLISEAEGNRIVEEDEVKSPFSQPLQDAFFGQQPVRVSRHSQPGDLRREFPQNLASPGFFGVRSAPCGVRHSCDRFSEMRNAPSIRLISKQIPAISS